MSVEGSHRERQQRGQPRQGRERALTVARAGVGARARAHARQRGAVFGVRAWRAQRQVSGRRDGAEVPARAQAMAMPVPARGVTRAGREVGRGVGMGGTRGDVDHAGGRARIGDGRGRVCPERDPEGRRQTERDDDAKANRLHACLTTPRVSIALALKMGGGVLRDSLLTRMWIRPTRRRMKRNPLACIKPPSILLCIRARLPPGVRRCRAHSGSRRAGRAAAVARDSRAVARADASDAPATSSGWGSPRQPASSKNPKRRSSLTKT